MRALKENLNPLDNLILTKKHLLFRTDTSDKKDVEKERLIPESLERCLSIQPGNSI